MTHEWKSANPHFPLLEAEWSSILILFSWWLTHFCMCLSLCVLSVFLTHYTDAHCLPPLPDSIIRAQPISFSLLSHLFTSHGQCSILQEVALEIGSFDSDETIPWADTVWFQNIWKICVIGLLDATILKLRPWQGITLYTHLARTLSADLIKPNSCWAVNDTITRFV